MNHVRFPPLILRQIRCDKFIMNIKFKNLARNKIAFISKKVYQRNAQNANLITGKEPSFALNAEKNWSVSALSVARPCQSRRCFAMSVAMI
jgi:hypothetical protein